MTRSTVRKFGVALVMVLGASPLAVMGGTAHALSNPASPQLTLSRAIASHPWSGTGTNASDIEGLGYVPGDDSLWVADDNGDRIFEINASTGAYKSQLDAYAFQAARQVGTTTSATATRTDDLESIVYDSNSDVLYVTSGDCCNSPMPGPPYFPTVFKLTRVSGHFSPTSWQPLPDGQDPTAAGWRPGTGMYFGKGSKIKTYVFATNTVGPDISLPVSPIVGLTFVSSSIAFVTTATANTATGRTTADSDSTIHRFDISGSTWTRNAAWTFPLKGTGMIDARDLAIAGDTFFASDGYDSRANDDHPIYVYTLGSAPSVGVGDAAVVEGATGTRSLRFSVTLAAAVSRDVTVQYGTVAGTASSSSDYTAVAGTLTIPAGAASSSFAVPVRGDSTVEDKESFGVRLSNPVGASLGRAAGTGRILNDDVSSGLKVAIGDASVVEGTSGTRSLRLTVSLSGAAPTTVAVSYATAGGTATSNTDFVARTGTVTIPAGSTSTSFTVSVRGDTTVEPNETFTVRLLNASGAAIGRTTGVATVLNDD